MEEDESLNKTYQMLPNTRLSELMKMWKYDFELHENYVFVSADEETTYHDDSMTLEIIGETAPRSRMVNLRAELICESTIGQPLEVFVYLNDKCHNLFVKPQDKLYDVLWRLSGKSKCLEYNGFPLNLKDTVQQAGLQNKAVVYESLYSITVKLSSGVNVVVQLPANSLVWNLKEKVNFYESDDFALKYQGRYLKSSENIRQLKDVVEVMTAEYNVNVNGRCVSWKTKDEPIAFSNFISQLAIKADIDERKLEMLEFVCIGCQRRICHSHDYVQQLPIECCKRRSLTLDAMSSFESETNSEANTISKLIRSLQQKLEECVLQRTTPSRCMYREMKMELTKERLNYNVIVQSNEKIMKQINAFEDIIKKLETNSQTLKKKNIESKKETETPQITIIKSVEDRETMTEDTVVRSSCLPSTPSQDVGVKLLVFYSPTAFCPISRPEVERIGRYSWKPWPHIKCHIPWILSGWTSFEELQDVLKRLFNGPEIKRIVQDRGYVSERVAVRVTFCEEDEAAGYNQSPYCDVDGEWHSWDEVGKPRGHDICKGGRAFMCGRRRRTVLQIYS